jgi:nucleotide-binding universal stress UspA family protein
MRDVKKILCPVDLSDVSRHTIAHAALLARWYKARIAALHVCNPVTIPATDFARVGADVPGLTAEELKDAREQVAACFSSITDVDIDLFVQTGQPAKQILAAATSLSADMIVIGTHGAGGFEHLLLGSVAEKVLRRSPCPVLTVPPQSRTTSTLPFKRILCPIDFSDSSLAALEFAFSLAQEGDADLTMLHVFEWPEGLLMTGPIVSPEYRQSLESDASTRLENLVPAAVRDYCRPSIRFRDGKAHREILGVATDERCDLIIMGVHGRNVLDLMLFGSTTNQVIRHATCPVLTLKASTVDHGVNT